MEALELPKRAECAICLDIINAPRRLLCGHEFHNKCIEQLETKICPLCRQLFDLDECLACVCVFYPEGTELVRLKTSIYSTDEDTKTKVAAKCTKYTVVEIERLTRASNVFKQHSTLADYGCEPGTEVLLWMFVSICKKKTKKRRKRRT